MTNEMLIQLAVSLGLGILVGFQREWTAPHVAGLRTFALITVLGAVAGLLTEAAGGWIVAAGFVAVAAMLVVGFQLETKTSARETGLTTFSAALLMYTVGAVVVLVSMPVGVVLAGAAMALLHWKKPLHDVVRRVGQDEIRGIVQLVLIGLVILPALPNETYGPYDVLNPRQIWLMVALICGVSLAGYMLSRLVGPRAGLLLCGLLGGLISSTATTISYSRNTRRAPATAGTAAVAIMLASTVVFARVLFEVAVAAPAILPQIAWPMLALMGFMAAVSCAAYFAPRAQDDSPKLEGPPFEVAPAIFFGLLYAVVLLAAAVAKDYFGHSGLYAVAVFSGLCDMDAITLSTSRMILNGNIEADVGWRMIMTGALSNLAFKGGAVALLGHPQLWRRMALLYGLSFAAGAAILLFWP